MVLCIVGRKGSGKTKQLVDQVNEAAAKDNGNVVCIEYNRNLTFDISHDVRLIDISTYPIDGYDALFGFICGVASQDYDLTSLFIDNLYKAASSTDMTAMVRFVQKLESFAEIYNLDVVITISEALELLPQEIGKYIH